MSTRNHVEDQDQVFLDGFFYNLVARTKVRSQLASNFAPKVTIGPSTQDSHEDISVVRWDNWTEGIGLEEFGPLPSGAETPKRAWFSTCDLSNVGHLTLGPLATVTADVEDDVLASAVTSTLALATFRSELYSVFNNLISAAQRLRIYKYNNSTDSWGSALSTFNSGTDTVVQDAVVGFIGGTEYIVFTSREEYHYSSDGSSWTISAKDADYITIWDDRLWGVDQNGVVWYATTPGTETNVAPLPIPPSPSASDFAFVTNLFVARNRQGDPSLYAATAFGLFIYDADNDRWLKTDVEVAEGRFNGLGTRVWNGDIYMPAGMGMYQVVVGETTLVLAMGPDRDHGLPTDNRGAIIATAANTNMLVAAIDPLGPDFQHLLSSPSSARDQAILAWDGNGWQVLWIAGIGDGRPRNVHISSAYGAYRLWFTVKETGVTSFHRVYYIDIPSERTNPNQVEERDYAASSVHETPDFTVGEDVTGIALAVVIEVKDTSADETVKLEYSTDSGATYTTLDTLGAAMGADDGTTEYPLPNATTPQGVEFHRIRFRETLSRGATTTLTPDVRSLTLKFLKKLPSRWNHMVALDISESIGDQAPRDQWKNLRTTMNKKTLVEFTFRDDTSASAEQRYWVLVKAPDGEEDTGLEYRGRVFLQLIEPSRGN